MLNMNPLPRFVLRTEGEEGLEGNDDYELNILMTLCRQVQGDCCPEIRFESVLYLKKYSEASPSLSIG